MKIYQVVIRHFSVTKSMFSANLEQYIILSFYPRLLKLSIYQTYLHMANTARLWNNYLGNSKLFRPLQA